MPNERTTALENYEAFAYARDNGHLDFISKAEKCDNYFEGQQWDPAHVQRLERLGKPTITLNKVLSTCATLFGEQLANRSDVSFRPAREGTSETATALDKVWLMISSSNNLDWLESEVAADGFIRSRGFFDLRASFDDHMMGEARITLLNSKNVVIDPDAEAYDPDGWKEVFITKWFSAMDIERVYGSRFARELRNRPGAAFTHTYDTVDWAPDSFGGKTQDMGYSIDEQRRRMYRVIERQYKELRWVEHFVNPQTGDMREIPPTWDRERVGAVIQDYGLSTYRKRVEQIRWTTSLDDILMHNKVSPYKHFTPIPYFPFFRHGTTIGLVENMLSPSDLLNKSVSQELHIVNTTANSGWKIKEGALANMTPEELEERGGEDGLVIITNGPTSDVEKIQPNQVPTGIDRLSFKADEALKEVSMVSDSMRGFDRADVAAKAIEAKRSSGVAALAKPFENLAYTRQILARNTLDIIQAFYTEERILNVIGRGLADEPEELTINQTTPEGDVVNDLTLGEYTVVVNTVPARDSFMQDQFGAAMDMRREGIAVPDHVLIENSPLSRKGEIAQEIKELNGQGEPSQTQQRLAELDIQLKEIEVQEGQADIAVKQSNAALNTARAQETGQPDTMDEGEMLKLAMDREKNASDAALKEQELLLKEKELLIKERELLIKKAALNKTPKQGDK